MLIPIHAEITRLALEKTFTPLVLEKVIRANQKQDAIARQIGYSEIHFDNNQIKEGQAYLQNQRDIVVLSIKRMDLDSAWKAFGMLLHTAQDFYAHTNYVSLWLEKFDDGAWPSADEIDPLDESILSSSLLRSGKLYYPLELLSFIPFIKRLVIPVLPRDSHAWMNLDSPASGRKFEFAFSGAVKRTVVELEMITEKLPVEIFMKFING